MINLNRTIRFAVDFAFCCEKLGVKPHDMGRIVQHVRNHVKAYERDDTKRSNEAMNHAVTIAEANGCELDWPGLYPCIQKKGDPTTNRMLPCQPD